MDRLLCRKPVTLYLSRNSKRQLRNELDQMRILVAGQRVPDEFLDLRGQARARLDPLIGHHERLRPDQLAEIDVLDHRAAFDRRVPRDRRFDDQRRDPHAANLERVDRPADVDIALPVVADEKVVGVEPAVAEHPGRIRRIAEVAASHGVAAHPQGADLAVRGRRAPLG